MPVVRSAPTKVDPAAQKSAADHNTRGRELLNQRKFHEAIEELNEAIRQQPDFALAYNARGFAYYLMHDYPPALADFDQAIRLNPKYPNAYLNRSRARKASGDAAGSTADAAKAREFLK
jgi:tetratricopeptide (TPR) repeat protein